jgi:predicted transcriptional regulator
MESDVAVLRVIDQAGEDGLLAYDTEIAQLTGRSKRLTRQSLYHLEKAGRIARQSLGEGERPRWYAT